MNVSNFDVQLTKNFKLSEFIKSDVARKYSINEQYIVTPEIINNVFVLCTKILQPLRGNIGAVNITSGYRCAKLNHKIGGAKTSQHLTGSAADFTPKCIGTAVSQILKLDFDQLIIYNSFIHVSYKLTYARRQIIDYR